MLYVFLITDFKVDTRVLIYGAGETGLLTYSVLRDLKENKVLILGFIDDNKRKSGKKIENGCTEPLYGEKSKCVLKIIPFDDKESTFQIDKKCIKKILEWRYI